MKLSEVFGRGGQTQSIQPIQFGRRQPPSVQPPVGQPSQPSHQHNQKSYYDSDIALSNRNINDMGKIGTEQGNQVNKFKEYLESQGFKILGWGNFGVVFSNPSDPWVYKIFSLDSGFLYYIKWVMANQQNPNVPKTKGDLIKINNNTYAVRMEKLTKINPGDEQSGDDNTLIKILDPIDTLSDIPNNKLQWIRTNYPGIYSILEYIGKTKYKFDFTTANMMYRGGTLVIVDPIFEKPDNKSMNENDGIINELAGYKSINVYNKAKELFDPTAMSTGDDEYDRRREQLIRFTDFLKDNGFNSLGRGSWGTVFEKSGYPWVFKIFHNDRPYLSYLKWVIRHQNNTAVPKIKGGITRITYKTYVVRMERLKSGDNADVNISTLKRILLRLTNNIRNLSSTDEDFISRNYPDVYKVLVALSDMHVTFDLHHNNIMLRNDHTPVIVDPIVDYNLTESEVVNELIGYKQNPVVNAIKHSYSQIGTAYSRMSKFIKNLEELGYHVEYYVSGTRGSVLKRNGDPYVIKIFQRDKDYMKYVQYALEHQDNPHVPKIKGKLIKIMDNLYAVRIEELYKVTPRNEHQQRILNDIYATSKWAKFYVNKYMRATEFSLYKLLTDLSDVFGPGSRPDFSNEPGINNIMQRKDGTIVINDPA